jgi:uroporphyrinogen decarboxylase
MEPILVQALRGQKTSRIPFWYMRQAGRYLPEYNEIRLGRTFVEVMESPDLSVEISLQPYRRFHMDGVIMFSDILTPLRGAGIPLHFEDKKGPVLGRTIHYESELSMFSDFQPEKGCGYVVEILQRLRAELAKETSPPGLLGFAGAPFTLASYLIEGGSTSKFEKTKGVLFSRPEFFARMSEALTELTIRYLTMQVNAGAQAVQIFDSWGGVLARHHYQEFSVPYTSRIIQAVQKLGVPVILFTGNSAHLLDDLISQKPDCISLDWRITPEEASRIPASIALQGNMDPLVLYGSKERTITEVRRVLSAFGSRKGYVFNLGHGIHPQSSLENVDAMLQEVRMFQPA